MLKTSSMSPQDAENNLVHFWQFAYVTMARELPNAKTVELLRDMIMDRTGMSGQPLSDPQSETIIEHSEHLDKAV